MDDKANQPNNAQKEENDHNATAEKIQRLREPAEKRQNCFHIPSPFEKQVKAKDKEQAERAHHQQFDRHRETLVQHLKKAKDLTNSGHQSHMSSPP